MNLLVTFLPFIIYLQMVNSLGVIFPPQLGQEAPGPGLSNLTSGIFNPHPHTGLTPVYNFLSMMTSSLYQDIAKAFINFIAPISETVNTMTGYIFPNGFSANHSAPYPTMLPSVSPPTPSPPTPRPPTDDFDFSSFLTLLMTILNNQNMNPGNDALQTLSNALGIPASQLNSALIAVNLTVEGFQTLLSATNTTIDQTKTQISAASGNVVMVLQNLLQKIIGNLGKDSFLAQYANSIGTSLLNLVLSILKEKVDPTSLQNKIIQLKLTVESLVAQFGNNITLLVKNILQQYENNFNQGWFQQLGISGALLTGLDQVGASLGPVGDLLTHLVKGLLGSVANLLSSLLGTSDGHQGGLLGGLLGGVLGGEPGSSGGILGGLLGGKPGSSGGLLDLILNLLSKLLGLGGKPGGSDGLLGGLLGSLFGGHSGLLGGILGNLLGLGSTPGNSGGLLGSLLGGITKPTDTQSGGTPGGTDLKPSGSDGGGLLGGILGNFLGVLLGEPSSSLGENPTGGQSGGINNKPSGTNSGGLLVNLLGGLLTGGGSHSGDTAGGSGGILNGLLG